MSELIKRSYSYEKTRLPDGDYLDIKIILPLFGKDN
jgi:hypothetical protein